MQPYRVRAKAREVLLDEAAQRVVQVCRSLSGVQAVYAFGSYARRNVGPTSDLDLLIVRDTTAKRTQRDDDIREHLRLPVALDMLVVTPQEFRDQLPMTSFGATILREMRRLDAS